MNRLVQPVKLTVKLHPKADIPAKTLSERLECLQLRKLFGRVRYGENVPGAVVGLASQEM
jgi:hypothetical protein